MRTTEGTQRSAKELSVLVATLAEYWATVFPVARAELAGWRARAAAIPDGRVRQLALRTLEEESGLAEGAAIFATLVPRARRRRLTRLLVAWQVAYDYLDTLGEELVAGGSGDDARLYATLAVALDPDVPYAAYAGDGGYLDGLVDCCRTAVRQLPAFGVAGPIAVRAAERCAHGQTRTHAVAAHGSAQLERWARAQAGAGDYLWWEVAAGAISSLAVHAVLATAARPATTAAEVARVDAAYFPSICALSTLLDSTIDTAADAGTTNHRCTAYYADADQALARMDAIARIAAASARALPQGAQHAVILAGMAAYYAAAGGEHARVHRRVTDAVGVEVRPILWTLRLRERALRLVARIACRRLRWRRGGSAETADASGGLPGRARGANAP